MYYKVIYNGQVIDTLDHLSFVKYQAKHGIMVNCTADDAEGIVSSDGRYIGMWTDTITFRRQDTIPCSWKRSVFMNMTS